MTDSSQNQDKYKEETREHEKNNKIHKNIKKVSETKGLSPRHTHDLNSWRKKVEHQQIRAPKCKQEYFS